MNYYNQGNNSNNPKEIDVFNRFSRHNKLKTISIAISLFIVACIIVFFYIKSMYTYTIKFVADGGKVYGEELQSEYTYDFLEKTRVPEGLKKEGYYIEGFYKDEEMTKEYKFGRAIWKSRVIYVKWNLGYAVQLNFIAGEDDDDRENDKTYINQNYLKTYYEQYVEPGSKYTLPLIYNEIVNESPTGVNLNQHYGEQLLWYDNAEGKGEPFDTKNFTLDNNIPLYGKWFDTKEDKFDISEDGTLNRYLGYCDSVILPNTIKRIRDIGPNFNSAICDDTRTEYNNNYSVFDRVLSSLKTIYLNKDLESLGNGSFRSANKLKNVIFLGNKITRIPNQAFMSCVALKSITLPDSVVNIDDRAFYDASGLKGLIGTENIETIGSNAFNGCISLLTINLPKTYSIKDFAFASCYDLVDIYLGYQYRVSLNGYIFQGNDEVLIYVPNNLIYDYSTADYWSYYSDNIKPINNNNMQ